MIASLARLALLALVVFVRITLELCFMLLSAILTVVRFGKL